MSITTQEIYIQIVQTLSPTEQLRLVTLILNDLVQSNSDLIDQSDTWTEQDQFDLVSFSLQYAVEGYSRAEEPVE